MRQLTRITRDPAVMRNALHPGDASDRRHCRRAGRCAPHSRRDFPRLSLLEVEDIAEALSYATWRAREVDVS